MTGYSRLASPFFVPPQYLINVRFCLAAGSVGGVQKSIAGNRLAGISYLGYGWPHIITQYRCRRQCRRNRSPLDFLLSPKQGNLSSEQSSRFYHKLHLPKYALSNTGASQNLADVSARKLVCPLPQSVSSLVIFHLKIFLISSRLKFTSGFCRFT